MKIEASTYLIAELSGAVVPFVTDMRKAYNPDSVAWPVEITIAGSSGVGTFSRGQEVDAIVAELEPLIREFYFMDVAFEAIDHFPNTGIYFIRPQRELFDRMHRAVASANILFDPIDFPYNPHCSLKVGPPSDGDGIFENMGFPKQATIDCFSLYQPRRNGGDRIHKFDVGGAG